MKTIKTLSLLILLSFAPYASLAQDTTTEYTGPNSEKIEALQAEKERITEEEKEFLRVEVESINIRLENGSITQEEAERLKKEAAEKRARNIENRIAIIDNKIELLKRNPSDDTEEVKKESKILTINFGDDEEADINIFRKDKPRRYDRRTTSELVFAIGFNNAIIDDTDFGDTPYELAGSGFVELGFAWKTRVFTNSNALRLKYGFSFQWNKLNAKDNLYFEQDGNITELVEFPVDLNKSQFRMSNVVIPVHFEFGPSKKIERTNYFRYSTEDQFKLGIGGYAGFNIGTQQKLKYKEDVDRVKQKIRKDYNTTDFVYGISAYIGVDDISLYAKYDLNPIFDDQAFDQNNISVGVRFDLD
ncbi:MAG: hypothetical protein R3213_09295 [Flavobacteriaceae bacterium]|nr:hypothetical protein [Flavobacteriaceae bacterium]